jgi:hypothetical protein
VLEQLQKSVREVKEVANGYAFRYPAEISILLLLAEFISLESRCCPFLDFALRVKTERGPAWLTVTGPDGVKEFLEQSWVSKKPYSKQHGRLTVRNTHNGR